MKNFIFLILIINAYQTSSYNIEILGQGYVGLVTGACFSELGNNIFGIDIDKNRLKKLKNDTSPIYEPGLEKLLIKNKNKIKFTSHLERFINKCEIIILAVPTPMAKNGECDLKYIFEACNQIYNQINDKKSEKIIIVKSTVLPGTCRKIKNNLKTNGLQNIEVVSMPEFLREGSAIKDFFHTDRIIIGLEDIKNNKLKTQLDDLLKFFIKQNTPIIYTSWENAELIKYASNSFLATKITFANQLSQLCEKIGGDIDTVTKGMGLDKRIGKDFLNASAGFGGSCFPKDVMALINLAKKENERLTLLEETFYYNKKHIKKCAKKIDHLLEKRSLQTKKITIFGLSFKENTDDLRYAPSLKIIKYLKSKNIEINGFDYNIKKLNNTNVTLFSDPYNSVKNSDMLVILNNDKKFTELNYNKIKTLMRNPLILDTRRLLKNKNLNGFDYKALGVGQI